MALGSSNEIYEILKKLKCVCAKQSMNSISSKHCFQNAICSVFRTPRTKRNDIFSRISNKLQFLFLVVNPFTAKGKFD